MLKLSYLTHAKTRRRKKSLFENLAPLRLCETYLNDFVFSH
jgi:hypothetical protein